MGIKLTTPKRQVDLMIRNKFADTESKIINNLIMAGEEAVKYARENGNYKDRSGNLRSSIGYVIVRRGDVIVRSKFEVVKKGYEGSKEGLELALDLAKDFPTDYVLIVVAGMNYATNVERMGYDVLSSSQLKAERIVKRLMKKI